MDQMDYKGVGKMRRLMVSLIVKGTEKKVDEWMLFPVKGIIKKCDVR